jgi:TonB-dependent starch-binding outer membrane protein SusC
MKFFTRCGIYHGKEWQRLFFLNKLTDPAFKRTILMRLNLIAFFLLFTIMHVCAKAYAQEITLSKEDVPLKTVLLEIKKQSGLELWYNNKHLKQSKNVTINISKGSLKEVLDKCFEDQPLTYEIVEKTIVVKPKPVNTPRGNVERFKRKRISGKVTDATGKPLSDVTITVKGSVQKTTTDREGHFEINVPSDKAVLLFSYVGYESFEQSVEDQSMLIVVLKESASRLDEVQVIAYGTTTQRLSTGSISSVKAEDIEKQPVSNPLSALQGRVAGLVITQSTGVPGSSFKVQLRGQSSLDLQYSRNDPLFIIDGVPFESGNLPTNRIENAANNPTSASSDGLSPLNAINPENIERIDVLKDADATAIYGSRGANGVILITTKKGRTNKTEASIKVHTGISQVGRSMEMLNLREYITMRKEAFANDGIEMTTANAPDIMLWDTTRYTDLNELLIGNNGTVNTVNANVSGGTGLTRFRVGAGYHRATTVYSSSMADRVSSFSFNVNHASANNKLNIILSGIYGNDLNQLPRTDLTRYINLPPNLNLYNDDGSLRWSDQGVDYKNISGIVNPLSFLNQETTTSNETISGSLALSYRLLNSLLFRINSGYNKFSTDEYGAKPSTGIDITSTELPSAVFANSFNRSWIVEPQLEFNTGTTSNRFNILFGATVQEKLAKGTTVTGTNYSSDLLLKSIAAAGSLSSRNDFSQYRYAAIFGRINYNKDDKYIINLTGRRDGSSRFGPDKQWANFGAVGVAWIFSKEQLFSGLTKVLSFGKLRASYGKIGNDQIGDYKFLNLWQSTPSTYNNNEGLFPISLYNPDYSWEINKKLEVGLDLGFFNDKVLLTGNFYRNRSENQLISYMVAGQSGFSNIIRNFPGLVQNTGLEFVLTTANLKFGTVNWSASLNVSLPNNKLLAFPGLENSSYARSYLIGKSLSIFQGYSYTGLDPNTGIYSFEDLDGDGQVYDVGDYKVFKDLDPSLFGGFQNNFSYRNWGLGFFFQFTKQLGANYIQRLGSSPPGFLYNQPKLVMERWQNPGDQSEIQKFTSTFTPTFSANSLLGLSNGAYTDASFVRLKNVSLSYDLPQIILKHLHISRLRLYIEGQNLLTFTGYKGLDPETQDFYRLPPLRTIAGGIQIDF